MRLSVCVCILPRMKLTIANNLVANFAFDVTGRNVLGSLLQCANPELTQQSLHRRHPFHIPGHRDLAARAEC